jgi:hypothetical protein
MLYTIGIIIMTKGTIFSLTAPGGDDEVGHMYYSNGI